MCSAGSPSTQVQYAATATSSVGSSPSVSRQADGARGDVDVGDLLGDGLELRELAAELFAVPDVVGGEVARPGQHTGGGEAESGDREPAEQHRGVLSRQNVALGSIEDDRVLGGAPGRRRGPQGDPLRGGVDQRDHDPLTVVRGHEQGRGVLGVRHPDLAPGQPTVGQRGRGVLGDPRPDLPDRRRQEHLTGGDARQKPSLLLGAACRGKREGAAAERLPHRQLAGPAAHLAQQDGHLAQAQPFAPVLLGHRQGQEPGRGQGRPVRVALERLPDHVADRSVCLDGFGTHRRVLLGGLSGVREPKL